MASRGAEPEPVQSGARAGDLPFVGRDREFRALLGALSAPPTVVLVEGEAGIGKSRLVTEASAALRADGVTVVTGACHPLREPLPYGPVVDALGALGPQLPANAAIDPAVGVLGPLLPGLAGRLPPTPVEVPGPSGQRHLVAGAVRALLAAVAPVVLVVEDVHWADEATQELLVLLASGLPADTALVLTYRGEDLPSGAPVLGSALRRQPGTAGAELSLLPLGREAMGTLARSVLGQGATASVVHLLAERSEGLPLVLEEDLITLAGRDPAAGADGETELRVPRSLRELLAARIGLLGPDATALVRGAAVLAVPGGAGVLGAIAGLDEERAHEALLAALDAAVLRERGPDAYGFGHALARQAVYDMLPGPVRIRAHRRVLAVLREQDPPPLVQIAHHTRALGDDTWITEARAAADQAAEVGDIGTAVTLLRQVLDQPGLATERLGETALALAGTVQFSIDAPGSVSTLRRILATPGLPSAVGGEIRSHLANVLLNQAGDPVGRDEMEKAALELEEVNPALAARNMSVLAVSDTGAASAEERTAWMARALRLLERTPDRLAHAVVRANQITLLLGSADPRIPSLLAALPRVDDDSRVLRATAIALSGAAEAAVFVGLDQRAPTWNEESLAISERIHFTALAAYGESYRLLLTWTGGHWERWDAELAAYRVRFRDSPLTDTGLLGTAQGVIAAARGQASRAAALFERVVAHDPTSSLALGAAAGTARLHLARGDAGAARASLAGALDSVRARRLWPFAFGVLPAAVEAALAVGDRTGARTLLEEHADGIRDGECPGAEAEQDLCRGLVLAEHDPGAAFEAFDRAGGRWEAVGRPYEAALAAERAALALAAVDPWDGRARFGRVLAAFDALGATSDGSRCRRRLRTLGPVPTNPRGRTGYGDELSPREREVAALLAAGEGNRDIAAALFVSPRTAEHHVAAVLRKLRTTRAALRGKDT
ncbi:ATP-binding protein [Kitasatospora sp. NPDC058406]|uniref:ATP-binding protein n=1 Tax=Kitasatospora sp. NPDC058406 TaxID=3346483 RepID=UPI003668BEEB